jgi:hypothetical protein
VGHEDARTYPDRVKYPQEARSLWRTSVPHSGQAATIQGELLRAVEKLRDEAQRNGNINWDGGYETLIAYLRDNLLGSPLFGQTAVWARSNGTSPSMTLASGRYGGSPWSASSSQRS